MYLNRNLVKYCKTFTKEWEELRSQLLMQLFNMKYEKLLLAYNNNYIEYMCFTICKRIVYGNVPGTGEFYNNKEVPFSQVFEQSTDEDFDKIGLLDNITIKEDLIRKSDGSEVLDKIDEILNELHWYDKILFEYYFKEGYNLREISELTSINLKSIHANIKKTKEYIKNKLKEDGYNDYFN